MTKKEYHKMMSHNHETENYEARRAYKREYYKKNKEKVAADTRRNKLRRKYGISLEQYDSMELSQDGKCAICKAAKPLRIDHCHATGKVRGLLCHNCNTALGHFGDDTHRLQTAIAYLEAK